MLSALEDPQHLHTVVGSLAPEAQEQVPSQSCNYAICWMSGGDCWVPWYPSDNLRVHYIVALQQHILSLAFTIAFATAFSHEEQPIQP